MIAELPSTELSRKFLEVEQKTSFSKDPRRISAVVFVAVEPPIEEGKEEEEEPHHHHRLEPTKELGDPQLEEKGLEHRLELVLLSVLTDVSVGLLELGCACGRQEDDQEEEELVE